MWNNIIRTCHWQGTCQVLPIKSVHATQIDGSLIEQPRSAHRPGYFAAILLFGSFTVNRSVVSTLFSMSSLFKRIQRLSSSILIQLDEINL